MTHRIIPAIMSGGAGTRLWPLSTEDKPKQFHALMGGRSLFAETIARVRGELDSVSFAAPIVLCGQAHVAQVNAAMRETGVAAHAIVAEPAPRNTAAVAVAAAVVAQSCDPDALVLLTPSDHVVTDPGAFRAAVARAAPWGRQYIVTFGASPTRPATGYGYIKRGAELGDGVFAVERFKEKPDAMTAQGYIDSGDHYWNNGIFLYSPAVLLAEFDANPKIHDEVSASLRVAARNGDEIWPGQAYANAPALSLDVAVMEGTKRGAVAPCDFGWADIGAWDELWRLAPRAPGGFAVLGPAAAADASKIAASGVRSAIVDGDDLVVVAAPNGILIVPRARANDLEALRELSEQL